MANKINWKKIYGEEPAKWITWRGRHIPVDKDGKVLNVKTARGQYQHDKNMEETNKSYDKYVYTREKELRKDGKPIDLADPRNVDKKNKVSRYKDKYLKAYNKENDRNNAIINAEEYSGDISDLKGKHTSYYLNKREKDINKQIRNIITGNSRADKALEKYGYKVERDNSAQKEFGKRYFGKNVKIINEKTGKEIYSNYDNYFQSKDYIGARPIQDYSVKDKDLWAREHHQIKTTSDYGRKVKNITNEFNYKKYLDTPINKLEEDKLGEKVAQFKSDKAYLKSKEYDTKQIVEKGERYLKTKQQIEDYKNRIRKNDFHYAGEELYSDDPNRFGDKMRKYNDSVAKENEASAKRVEERYRQYVKETLNNDDYLRENRPNEYFRKMTNKNNDDISPMSEYSDTTGKGISDRQNKALTSMSMSELRGLANDYNIDTKGLSQKQLMAKLIAIFNK